MITSSANPLIKRARALRQRKARAETGLFLVEGIHPVGELIEAGWDVDAILHAPELLNSPFAHELLEQAARRSIRLEPVSASVMEAITDKDHPQGILAIARQRSRSFAELRTARRLVALVNPQDPGNVGSILRTIDAAGADGLLILDGGVDLYHPTLVRASMGTLFWKPVIQASFTDFKAWADSTQVQLIGTSVRGESAAGTTAPRPPWALVMGNEQKGLAGDQIQSCEFVLSLPMRGRVHSLNLAVAAGILLYQLTAGAHEPPIAAS